MTVNSNDVQISGFQINNSIEGFASLYLLSANNCRIDNNTFSTNGGVGMMIRFSSNNYIDNNSYENNIIGMYLYEKDNDHNTIQYNIMSNNDHGIWITESNWNSIISNTINGSFKHASVKFRIFFKR